MTKVFSLKTQKLQVK